MKHTPSLDSIEERLKLARSQFMPLLGLSEQVDEVPFKSWHVPRLVEGMLNDRNRWSTTLPSFLDVQEWVEAHWSTERRTQPPAGTVADGEKWGSNGEVQLDAQTATCKLLLAAVVHGVETVARYAEEFSVHGMIEVRNFYLLKGASVSGAEPLDAYCTLLPYQEALQKVNAVPSARDTFEYRHWPPENADDVCALETRSFESRGLMADEFERRVSVLLQSGPETLALVLGLAWGTGFRVFGHWHDVAEPVAATLPFSRTTDSRGGGSQQVLLTLPGFRRPSKNRPLNVAELVELMGKYATLSEQTRRVLNLALRRLQDSTDRLSIGDKVIDLGIALEALFSKKGEGKIRETVSSRGAWYFSDSLKERTQTYKLLQKFYDERSHIVHGNVSKNLARERRREQARQHMLTTIDNVVRASLKSMISEGLPQSWEDSKNPKSIRHNPPRSEADIPSVKSDSLSWTVAEQREIDRALEALWKPEVDNTPPPQPDVDSIAHQGIDAEAIERCRQQGIPYAITVPIRLYMAHPKWPKQEGDPVDERTKYYCGKDVEMHLQRWQKAASDKKIYQFQLDLEDPTMYLPEAFDAWREILQRGGLLLTQQASLGRE